jgi:hypothetical protein
MLNLNPDIWLSVASYLNVQEIGILSQVCTAFNTLITSNATTVWKKALLNSNKATALQIMGKGMRVNTIRFDRFPLSEEVLQHHKAMKQNPTGFYSNFYAEPRNINSIMTGMGAILARNDLLLSWLGNELTIYDKEDPNFRMVLGEHAAKINGAVMLKSNTYALQLFSTKPENCFVPYLYIDTQNTVTYYGYNDEQVFWSYTRIPDAVLGIHANSIKNKLKDETSTLTVEEIRAIYAHLTALNFHCSSTKALTWSDDGCLKVWELETASCVATLEGHTHAVKNVLCANGFIFSRSLRNELKIWDYSTYECLLTIESKDANDANEDCIEWDISMHPFQYMEKTYKKLIFMPSNIKFAFVPESYKLKLVHQKPELCEENELYVYLNNDQIHFTCLKTNDVVSHTFTEEELDCQSDGIKQLLANLDQVDQENLLDEQEQLMNTLEFSLIRLGFYCSPGCTGVNEPQEGNWQETNETPTRKRYQRLF